MRAELRKTDLAEKPSLTIKRRVNAPPSTVYAAWINPEIAALWMGPKGTKSAHSEGEVRVGGWFRTKLVMENGEEHNVGGVYREVTPNEKLVFTWAWRSTPERESLVTVTFKADGPCTMLTLKHEMFFDEAARDGHYGGWSEALDKLVHHFA